MRALPVLALTMAISAGGAASAAVLDPLDILGHANVVVYNNATTQADIEGQAVIGGNFSGATIYNHPTSAPLAGYGALTVYGSTSGNWINLNNGGSAYVGGTKGAGVNFNGGGRFVSTAPPDTISDFETALNNYSTALSQLTSNSATPALNAKGPNNNIAFNAEPNGQGVAVFDISAAQLSELSSYYINLNGADSVVFNVTGTSVDIEANEEGSIDSIADKVIWNFYQATSVTLGAQIGGTILAPYAAVTNRNQIDGALVANSWTGQGEVHDYAYTGGDPLPPSIPGGVPEPASWALMLLGVGGVGAGLRAQRRRAARAAAAG